MKTQTKTRITKRGVPEKYLNFLYDLKYNLDNNNVSYLNKEICNYNVNMEWPKFLTQNNIVYKDGSFYKWNHKIPVSIKIVNKFRENRHKNYVKFKNNQTSKQTKILFSNAPAIKAIQKTHLANEKTSTKQIGLIRKFLKWIY